MLQAICYKLHTLSTLQHNTLIFRTIKATHEPRLRKLFDTKEQWKFGCLACGLEKKTAVDRNTAPS